MLRTSVLLMSSFAVSFPLMADEAPAIPETAIFAFTTTAERTWAGNIRIDSYLYVDTSGPVTHFYEVYYLKRQTQIIRITWREAYGEELTIWIAPTFR